MRIARVGDILTVLPDAHLRGSAASRRRSVRGVSTDSRSIGRAQLFVALMGERFDAHDFVELVADRAAAALVNADWAAAHPEVADRVPLIAVDDTLEAYGRIAAAHRASFSIPVIAVGGSNGKTTTKDLIAELLAQKYSVLRTEGNLNNLIGTPATLLRMSEEHQIAVIEIGTNMPGEIARLCSIVNPTHGLITNVGNEHLELLGDLDGVAREEGSLFEHLSAGGGTAFVNLDDPRVAKLGRRVPKRITYGRSARADIQGRAGLLDTDGAPSLQIADRRGATPRQIEVQLRTPGRHTAINATAAAAVALSFKVAPSKIRTGLAAFEPRTYGSGYARLAVVRLETGVTVLNDTYNANPDSVLAAFATLRAMRPANGGRRVVVLGDMLELGARSAEEHARIGREIASASGIARALFFGPEMRHAHNALVAANGAGAVETVHTTDKARLIAKLREKLVPGDILLVKGSRGMRMEEVIAELKRS